MSPYQLRSAQTTNLLVSSSLSISVIHAKESEMLNLNLHEIPMASDAPPTPPIANGIEN